ncbi:MAG: zinc ribbon domain-containing protein [Desulfatitalea sp.]|nr:zinc ribbon domain-containing protein [Desulfatitalea sp.]NNK00858.1 zinc ribbon domain-containing protein [Desulfatitalea sp.]
MPIYEFKCLKCEEYIEILVMGSRDEAVKLKCAKCGGEALERILSTTRVNIAGGNTAASGPSTQSRTCSSGSCTTWNLPGNA